MALFSLRDAVNPRLAARDIFLDQDSLAEMVKPKAYQWSEIKYSQVS